MEDFDVGSSRLDCRLKPLPSDNETNLMISLSVVIFVLGTVAVQYQCRRLSRRFREIRAKRVGVGQDEEVVLGSNDLREMQQRIQTRQRQSYRALAGELESMRAMQRDVKAKLASLQTLVDTVREQKQRGLNDSSHNNNGEGQGPASRGTVDDKSQKKEK